jgi:hypothetical protein
MLLHACTHAPGEGLPRSGRKRRSQTGTRLEIGLLIDAHDRLRLNKWTGVEVRQCMDELSKLLVARHFCEIRQR